MIGTAAIIVFVESGNTRSDDHIALHDLASDLPLSSVSETIISILNPAENNPLHNDEATRPAPAKEMLFSSIIQFFRNIQNYLNTGTSIMKVDATLIVIFFDPEMFLVQSY